MARKNVTIRELRQAAKDRGWKEIWVGVYRSPVNAVFWWAIVESGKNVDKSESVEVRFNSRQGAMRMALAALRAKTKVTPEDHKAAFSLALALEKTEDPHG